MAFLTQEDLDNRLDLPVSQPTTLVEAEDWIVVATIRLMTPMQFTLSWLQLQLIEVINPYTSGAVVVEPDSNGLCVFPASDITLTNADYGLAYLALYRGFVPSVNPTIQPAQEPPLVVGDVIGTAPAIAVRSLEPTIYATEGIYSFVLVNNTTNRNLRLTANGQVVVNLNPL